MDCNTVRRCAFDEFYCYKFLNHCFGVCEFSLIAVGVGR